MTQGRVADEQVAPSTVTVTGGMWTCSSGRLYFPSEIGGKAVAGERVGGNWRFRREEKGRNRHLGEGVQGPLHFFPINVFTLHKRLLSLCSPQSREGTQNPVGAQ